MSDEMNTQEAQEDLGSFDLGFPQSANTFSGFPDMDMNLGF